jgi:hypothetical protein
VYRPATAVFRLTVLAVSVIRRCCLRSVTLLVVTGFPENTLLNLKTAIDSQRGGQIQNLDFQLLRISLKLNR